MGTPIDKIVMEALALPAQARAFVAEKLIESLDAGDSGPLSAAWREEVLERCRQIDAGSVALREADSVFADAYAALE